MRKITVSDVTIRAFSSENISLTFREKLSIAEKLDLVNVDAIELPTLKNLKEDEVIFQTIAKTVKNAVVKIPVGVTKESVENAYSCIEGAVKPCLQIALPTSTTQMEYFYHLKAPAMLEKMAELISLAKEKVENVEVVCGDVFRAEEGFIEAIAKLAEEKGATSITLVDDAGDAFPEDYFDLVKKVKGASSLKVLVMPSDKLKLSASSALQAIKAGADGVVTSTVGAYLKASVLSDITRAKKYDLDAECNLDVTKIKTILSSINKDENENVTTLIKSSGNINADACMKDVVEAVKNLGYELSDEDNGKVFEEFKRVANKKEAIELKELEAIIASTAMQVPSTYHLVNYVVNSSNIISATANITLEKNGERFTGVSTGDGPIDAAFHAIEQVIGHHYELDDFQVHAVTKGREAVGSSLIRLRAEGKLFPGNGVSTDIVGACIRAYINALNKIVYEKE